MAKKDDYHFRVPKFDDKEIVRREIFDSQLGIFLIGYAVILGLISYGIIVHARLNNAGRISILLVFLSVMSLRHILPKIFPQEVLSEFMDKKKWVASALSVFFLWLSFTTILINPPVSDIAPPSIMETVAYVDGNENNSTPIKNFSLSYPANITLRTKVVDNYKVEKVTLRILGSPNIDSVSMENRRRAYWYYSLYFSDSVEFTITAYDHLGQSSMRTESLRFGV